MLTSGTWPLESSADFKAFATLGIELAVSARDAASLLAHGNVDAFPLGCTSTGDLIGLRAIAGRPLNRCPIVRIPRRTGESTVVSNDAANAVPFALLEQGLLGEPGTWKQLGGLGDAEWSLLREAHLTRGGEEQALSNVRELLGNPSLAELDDWRASPMSWPDAWSDAVQLVDPNSARHRLQVLIKAVEYFEPYEAPTPESLGAFELLGWATAMQLGPEPAVLDQAAHRATRLPAGHEAAYTNLVGGPVDRGLAAGEFGLCAKAGRRLGALPEPPRDPLAMACVAAAEAFATYDGIAHATAAAALRETGDYAGAVSAMLSALFWSQASHGTVNEPMVGAYRELIREAGFETHIEVLDRLVALAG